MNSESFSIHPRTYLKNQERIVVKKLLFSLLLGILCIVGVQPVYAAGQLLAFLPEGQDCYYLNGTLVNTGEQQWHTFNYAGHTYFPIRTISELFGFQVQWQPDTQTIRLSDEKQITAQTYSCEELLALAQE